MPDQTGTPEDRRSRLPRHGGYAPNTEASLSPTVSGSGRGHHRATMTEHRRVTQIARLKRGLKSGQSHALLGNIAVAYRALGNRRRAFEWWRRAAGPDDGDSFVEVAYCLHYGIGVTRDPAAAMKAYRDALKSRSITAHGWEEALYHLAVAHLDMGGKARRERAITLLRRASADGDYPAASRLLAANQSPLP